jgi:hypothetical protein
MNLKDAFPRPSTKDTETALQEVLAVTLEARPWRGEGWKVAAVVAGLFAAYAAGFASGRHVRTGQAVERAPIVEAGGMTIRPPVLIAGPRS